MEGYDYTNWQFRYGQHTQYLVQTEGRSRARQWFAAILPSAFLHSAEFGCSIIRSGFFSMYKPVSAKSSLRPSSYHHPPTSPSSFAPTLLPSWPKCFPLSRLISLAGMAQWTATQPETLCNVAHIVMRALGTCMLNYLLLTLASNFYHF